ncbi:hypothetical protein L873DRAFT_1833842 [Choiromyces venosus 120613-1]|uniref:S-adenosyl-L-methionine-dependent methyltransferase n=1 Tax=Choiromyces venosus 120613-1 TaxID=1336337 RepID=A0A3N4JYR6_9PEZI|nr:hypothetical protein L873DRAFT_1833842 [Choiromyces venosus 120613-1]
MDSHPPILWEPPSTSSGQMFTPLDIQMFTLAASLFALSLVVYFLLHAGKPYAIFFYSCFLKPFSGNTAEKNGGQQDALESFYKGQAGIYDATRGKLLRGREEMLALAAAQLKHRLKEKGEKKAVWVDIGGGTGYNIETLNKYLSVQGFFSKVYLVDLSPSLCDVARERFTKLGWKNVEVVCMDARVFKLEEKADWISMSYSLSMIPDFYSVIDSLSRLLSPEGIISVADFYVQSSTNFTGRTYTGGVLSRHVNWFSRQFWRVWFEFDRVNLDEGRRDYLEYKFGTVLSVNERNRILGGIPYYIWIGCQKLHTVTDVLALVDAAATESPYLSPIHHMSKVQANAQPSGTMLKLRSKGFEAAVLNLATNLPLPSAFYQNHHWRIYYDELLQKHTQFNNSYIYAFTWEDPRVDQRILKINSDDVVLAITSAGDNILHYLIEGSPKRIHAVDLNPTQNHLLELKLAAFSTLPYEDMWKIFGLGRHSNFEELLVNKLSPHLSSHAFQYWFDRRQVFTSRLGGGLYETGQSRLAIIAAKWLFRVFGVSKHVERMCAARTLNEQREIWRSKVRPVILSQWVSWAIIDRERFLWKALGVPVNQRDMIIHDHHQAHTRDADSGRRAMWEYVINTLDPVVENSLLGEDNYFYNLCLLGHYTETSRPSYLCPKSHAKLSRPGALDNVRIHTDEINHVLARLQPGTLSIAVIMDSMDWFDTDGLEARKQINSLNAAMKIGGRVLIRSAGREPWYMRVFEEEGFKTLRVGDRAPGSCIDRVNMYASAWVCTKVEERERGGGSRRRDSSGSEVEVLEI